MATLNELIEGIELVKAKNDTLSAKIDEFKLESTNAFNRLNQLVLEGVDVQPAIDALAPLSQAIDDKAVELDSAIAEAKLEG